MWSASTRQEEKKEERENETMDIERNIRFIHMQISTPKNGNKTRAQKVKEALMIIFATSKYIKLHPKEARTGEILTNIDDLVTTEEVTDQYFFDKKIGGKKYIRGEGSVDYYVTKVRLETDISLNQMKWHTSTKFLEALKTQHIFLQEYKDGKAIRTGNVGWIAGMNPTNTSVSKVTRDLNRILKTIDATAIIDVHTVSIRFPSTKKAFVTRAYKIVSDNDKLDEAKKLIRMTIKNNNMGIGWEDKELVDFSLDKNTTAMMIERHNKKLHETAVVRIRNIWSITARGETITRDEMKQLGLAADYDDDSTIEDMWWHLANRYQHDVQGMVARRGTLEILTTRQNLNDTMGFARELINNTITVLGDMKFAQLTANFNPETRQPLLQEAPMILSGKGRVKIDTTLFSEEEFKSFASKHGIPIGADKTDVDTLPADNTRPPKAFYHKAGREPVEHDPRKMRDGARSIWEQFTNRKKNTEKQTELNRRPVQDDDKVTESTTTARPPQQQPSQMSSEDIIRKGKMIRLENSMKAIKSSQEAMEQSTANCHSKIESMKNNTEESISKISDMIEKMGEAITSQNQKLAQQAASQLRQAEDIQKMMTAIGVISRALHTATPTSSEENTSMNIDIPESNQHKRKQSSPEFTTLLTEETIESVMTQPIEATDPEGVHNAGGQ